MLKSIQIYIIFLLTENILKGKVHAALFHRQVLMCEEHVKIKITIY